MHNQLDVFYPKTRTIATQTEASTEQRVFQPNKTLSAWLLETPIVKTPLSPLAHYLRAKLTEIEPSLLATIEVNHGRQNPIQCSQSESKSPPPPSSTARRGKPARP